ncbi:MAG: UDP-N-acetylmuramoyl-L-alanyl-D-glutamate--2,6-diaminopimelate ligase [Pseudomonadota bacterium]
MKTLAELGLADLPVRGPDAAGDLSIAGICVDSRETKPGYLFAALKGEVLDGAEFAQFAVRMEAAAVLISAEGAERAKADIGDWPIPFLISDNPRRDLALASAKFYGAQPKTIVAITGTNGKTSVASFSRQVFAALGRRAANFGTVGVEGAVSRPLSMTTPEPVTLHRLLAELAEEGVTHAAMEASSHGLAQHRLDGVRLTAGAFTNFSRDHLDYHATTEDYLNAKLRLLRDLLPKGAPVVLGADDPAYGAMWRAASDAGLKIIPFGRGEEAEDGLRLLDARYDAEGQSLDIAHQGQRHSVRLNLIGGFQGLNALAAAGLAIGCGEAPSAAIRVLETLTGVRGRMEHVATRANGAGVYVDYSHTPDGLANALAALRLHTPGRLIVVFGAGGDRDPGKRPLMGHAACEGADGVIVTDDNPRTEDPAPIRKEIIAACATAIEIGDRAEAILTGVDALSPDDRLLIAGKGHETGQIVGDQVIPFDDAEQARVAVAALDGLDDD